jgi:hypothetical protein
MGSQLPDDDLADRWEHQQLGGSGVSHLDHVRVAWVLHQRHGASEAEERLVEGTRRGCDHYGVPEKFDEDLTRSWARAVSGAAVAGSERETFDAFIVRNPDLRRGDLFGKPQQRR